MQGPFAELFQAGGGGLMNTTKDQMNSEVNIRKESRADSPRSGPSRFSWCFGFNEHEASSEAE